jgi:DNA primase
LRYPASILDDIRARLPLSAVVGRKVRLAKAGREWKALSPFNQEKTPSFYVNDQKGFYHCFSSGKHGDAFTFLMETEGLSFPEAVERLAADAGVTLPKMSHEAEVQEQRRKSLYDVVELACRFFEAQLQTGRAQPARDYLDRRRIAPATRAEFRMGFAPDSRTALLDHLRSHEVEDDQILAAGLAIAPEDGRGLYDRFRGRIIIPIQDSKGRVVGFGGRALSPDTQPKYLNSPETELFRKGEIVFNGHRAREVAHRTASAIVVEGYLDAISVFQSGMKSVVATLGTAFTPEQIKALWRLAPEPVICFDGDKAGRAAAYRALDRILPDLETGWSFRFGFLPSGQDPDDFIIAEGKEAFARLVDEALPMWDVLWTREVGAANLSTPDGQAVLEKRLTDLIDTIRDKRLKRLYSLRAKVGLAELFWRYNSEKFGRGTTKTATALPREVTEFFLAGPARQSGLERIFLGLCVEFPDWALKHHERIARITLRGTSKGTDDESFGHQRFADGLIDLITTETITSARDVYRRLDPALSCALDYLHGRETPEKPMGYRLRERFPAMRLNTSPDFFERCFEHFLRMLELREMQDWRDDLMKLAPEMFDEDAEREVLALQGEIMLLRERVHHDENELAEEAQNFRKTSGPGLAIAALAA